MLSTRLGRRLSIRKKHLQPPDQNQQPDSAELAEGATTSMRSSPTDSKLLAPISESLPPGSISHRRASTPRLALFPATEPLTPSAASVRSTRQTLQLNGANGANGASPTPRPSAGKRAMASNGTLENGKPPGPPMRSATDRPSSQQPSGKPKEKEKEKERPKKERAFSLRRMFGQRQPHPNRAMMTYGDLA